MKLVLLTLLFPALLSGVPTDKVAHAGVGYALGVVSYALSLKVLRLSPSVSVGLSLAVPTVAGVSKELVDKFNGKPFSVKDLASTVAGGAAACGTVVVFELR